MCERSTHTHTPQHLGIEVWVDDYRAVVAHVGLMLAAVAALVFLVCGCVCVSLSACICVRICCLYRVRIFEVLFKVYLRAS